MNPTYPYRSFVRAAALVVASMFAACGHVDGEGTGESEANQIAAWQAPAEGTCEAKAIQKVANEATLDDLDVGAELDKRAAENIIAARPFDSVSEIDEVPQVGSTALNALLAYARAKGACAEASTEIGVVSDLDETVIPEAKPDLAKAPYPGVAALYKLLELRKGGAAGDVYYVTARTPERVVDVPRYLESHGVPGGPIETGTTGVPWVAQPEKVRDINGIFARTGAQRFVLLGDTAARDPEVYKEVISAHEGRVIAAFIHKVDKTVPPERVEGLHLHESYAEVAAILYELDVITRSEARDVMQSAKDEGLAITDAQMDALLNAHRP